MLVLEVEYLLGRSVASDRNDYESAEWPPHPGRLFMALVAAYHECDFGDAEREALLWLERQTPPAISYREAHRRDVVTVFVPVNDSQAPSRVPRRGFSPGQLATGLEVFPDRRPRQPRYFPAMIPDRPIVHFIWDALDTDEFAQHRPALERLAHNVTYLGHSSSLVRVAMRNTAPPATIRPGQEGPLRLRVPSKGRFEALERAYERACNGDASIHRPSPGRYCAYQRCDDHSSARIAESVFGADWFVYQRTSGVRVPLHACLKVTSQFRRALMECADQPPHEVLSGHRPDGARSDRSHVAFVPLPNVGSRYSDGALLGLAVVLPRTISAEERRHVLRALGNFQNRGHHLHLGRIGQWQLERVAASTLLRSLQPDRFLQSARRWASVTPVVLGHFPKELTGSEAEGVVRRACPLVGLPEPVLVRLSRVSPVLGTASSTHFSTLSTRGKPVSAQFSHGQYCLPRTDRDGNPVRLRVHALLEFDQPVRGPVLIGAGRYLGMGLFLPWNWQEGGSSEL